MRPDRRAALTLLVGLLTVLLLVPASAPGATPQTHIGGAGMYGLLGHNWSNTVYWVGLFLQHDSYAGISVRTDWDRIEATEDSYNWAYIDSMIDTAAAAGKRVILRVKAGASTPTWVYAAGADSVFFYEPWPTGLDPDTWTYQPVPWDPVFLRHWGDFVRALGARYASNPNLYAIHATGPSRTAGEMHLIYYDTDPARDTLVAKGYTPAALAAAWETVIDTFAEVFPGKPLLLGLSRPLYNDDVCTTVAAYAVRTYPWRCLLKICYWRDGVSEAYYPTAELLRDVDEFTHGGLEEVGAFNNTSSASDSAIAWHALTTLEIYPGHQDSYPVLAAEAARRRQMISSASFDASVGGDARASLAWTNPSGYAGFGGVRLLRRTGWFPAGFDDTAATLVYEGSGTSHLDTGLTQNTVYYFAMYETPSHYTIAVDTIVPAFAETALPVATVAAPSETGMNVGAPIGTSETFIQLNLAGGGTTSGVLATAANSTGAGANYACTTTLVNPYDTVSIPVWTNQSSMRLFVGLRSDTASLFGPGLPSGIRDDDTGRQAFGATVLLLELAGADGQLLGDSVTTTNVGETFAYTLRYLLSETTAALYRSLGFDTAPGSTSFRFYFADTYGAAWTEDTSSTVTVAAGSGGGLAITVAGFTRDLPGGLGGAGASGASASVSGGGCLLERLNLQTVVLAFLRHLRDLLLATPPGRLAVAAYYLA